VLKNQPHDQLATKVPITGAFQNTDVHIWPTIQTLLRNGFIRALALQPDQRVSVETAKKVDPSGAGLESSNTNRVQQIEKLGMIQMQETNQMQK
jgi:hypothetical protein